MAVDMFMKIEGIDGESTDKEHTGEIDVLAWSWGTSNSGTMHMGGGGGGGKANFQDLSFTKFIDKASSTLMLACATGKHIDSATLVCRKAGGEALEYLKITMENVLVTSVSTGGSGGEDRLTENVSLNFAKFEVNYQPQDAKGAADGGTIDFKFNIEANVAE